MKPVEYNHKGERICISAGSQWRLFPFPNHSIQVQVDNINETNQTVLIIDVDQSSSTYMQDMTISFDLWEKMQARYMSFAGF